MISPSTLTLVAAGRLDRLQQLHQPAIITVGWPRPRSGVKSSAAHNYSSCVISCAAQYDDNLPLTGSSSSSSSTSSPSADEGSVLMIKLPSPIVSLFPVHIHPEYESVKEECDQWAVSFFNLNHSSHHDTTVRQLAYLNGLYPLCTAASYPSANVSRERLLLVAKFITWAFIFDDVVDESDDQAQATELVDGFIAVLMHDHDQLQAPTSSSSASTTLSGSNTALMATNVDQYKSVNHLSSMEDTILHRFLERFRIEVWQQMRCGMSDGLRRRFVGEVMRSLKAMKEIWYSRSCTRSSMPLKANTTLHNVDDMIDLRLLDVFSLPTLILLEYALGIDIDAAPLTAESCTDGSKNSPEYLRSLVHDMVRAAARHVALVNDMFSCGKELMNMDTQSVVGYCLAVRNRQQGNSLGSWLSSSDQQAYMEGILHELWEMIQEQERVCAALLSHICNHAQHHDDAGGKPGHGAQCIVMYAQGICQYLSGSMYWTTCTGRYHGPNPIPWNTTPSYLTIPASPLMSLNVLSSFCNIRASPTK